MENGIQKIVLNRPEKKNAIDVSVSNYSLYKTLICRLECMRLTV